MGKNTQISKAHFSKSPSQIFPKSLFLVEGLRMGVPCKIGPNLTCRIRVRVRPNFRGLGLWGPNPTPYPRFRPGNFVVSLVSYPWWPKFGSIETGTGRFFGGTPNFGGPYPQIPESDFFQIASVARACQHLRSQKFSRKSDSPFPRNIDLNTSQQTVCGQKAGNRLVMFRDGKVLYTRRDRTRWTDAAPDRRAP